MSASKRFTSPSRLELALAFEVGETECDLPRSTGMVDSRETFPIIYLAWEIIMSSTSAMGMPAHFAFFCASSIVTMNWGMPSACT